MRAKRRDSHVDRTIAELAGSQHGLATRRQLLELGVGGAAIGRRVEAGRLHAVYRGVYAVGHTTLSQRGRWLAAVLACGQSAVLSHLDAAALWRLRTAVPRQPIVSVPGGCRSRRGITTHRTGALARDEWTVRHEIAVTSPVRTLVDLARQLPPRPLERAVDEALYRRLTTLEDLEQALVRYARRPGNARLRAVVEAHGPGTTLTRSTLEERMLVLSRRHGFPRPEVNASLAGFTVDFLWREHRLAVETDAYATHGSRTAFESDRARDAALAVAGYRTLRFTDRQIARQPDWVANCLRIALGL